MENSKQKNRLLVVGKVFLFTIIYAILYFLLFTIAQIILPFDKIYTPILFIISGTLGSLIGLAVLFLFLKVIDKEHFSAIGFSIRNHVKELFVGALFGIMCIIIGFLIIIGSKSNQIEIMHLIRTDYLLSSFFMLISTAILEEMLIRGYVLRKLVKVFPSHVALLLSSAIFTAFHLLNPALSLWAITNVFLAGILLGLLYLLTKNIWLVASFHFFWNYTQSIVGFNVSGEELPSILTLQFKEMNSFNGGNFGFEGSYVCSIILIISLIASYLYFQNKKVKQDSFNKV